MSFIKVITNMWPCSPLIAFSYARSKWLLEGREFSCLVQINLDVKGYFLSLVKWNIKKQGINIKEVWGVWFGAFMLWQWQINTQIM